MNNPRQMSGGESAVSAGNEQIAWPCETIEEEQKTAPGGAPTPFAQGLTTRILEGEVAMTSVPRRPTEDEKRIAVEALQLAADSVHRAHEKYRHSCEIRRIYIHSARRWGMTNTDIGAALGVSEAAVRGIVKRAGGAEG